MSNIFENLTGKLLISVPSIMDKRFEKTVIFMCGHDANGAIGIVLNKSFSHLTFKALLRQMEIDDSKVVGDIKIQEGGPVEVGRGFVLHTNDFYHSTTVKITPDIYLTATTDILKSIAQGKSPKHFKICLGYAGWTAGQIEREMHTHTWVQSNTTAEIMFTENIDTMWSNIMLKLGISNSAMSSDMGNA
jgi:putative transcriptional regulator